MTEQIQLMTREWREGESLESLAEGDIVRITDGSLPGNIDYPALYVGRENSKFVLLSRESHGSIVPDEKQERTLIRLKLSGQGELKDSLHNYKYFKFNGNEEDKDFFGLIEESHPEYQRLNNQLKPKGL